MHVCSNECSCCIAALHEAQDINLYLKPLINFFDDIDQVDFDLLDKQFPPLMHSICLVWANSKYYNTPVRIIVLLQELCNQLIDLVSDLLDSQSDCK
jgi:dynein heavy chain